MKAIIEISPRGSAVQAARRHARAGENSPKYRADYYMSFESARLLFTELTPARIDLLDSLRQVGPCSVYALAKSVDRNYSNVHSDIGKLEEHGLVARTPDDAVFVPFDAIEIRMEMPRPSL
ncbi:MarR family transcriptional regulator [Ramlibacter sp.]|uniref:HVO_A0114 family putative DNA-binding protein n=1 Tax=Ramlibacter sp. TaxID=1917967 RepID=UPI003D0BF250